MGSGSTKEDTSELAASSAHSGHPRRRRFRRILRKILRDPVVGLSFVGTVLLVAGVLGWAIYKSLGR